MSLSSNTPGRYCNWLPGCILALAVTACGEAPELRAPERAMEPNAFVAEVHDRMPLILAPEDYVLWCSPEMSGEAVRHLLRPFSAAEMQSREVSKLVNNARNDTAAILDQAII